MEPNVDGWDFLERTKKINSLPIASERGKKIGPTKYFLVESRKVKRNSLATLFVGTQRKMQTKGLDTSHTVLR